MRPSRIVVRRFGSLRKLAEALGHPSHTTVQGWWNAGLIPAQHQQAVIAAAAERGIEITPDELVNGNDEPEPAPRGEPAQSAAA